MSLPPLDRLRSTRTGEFYPLSEEQVNDLNREEAAEPITQQRFQLDAEPREGWWHTFRVELKQSDGSFKDQFYRAESLWEWYQRSAGSARPPTDPLTRQPVWHEDWWALHERLDPQGAVPGWARTLPRLEVVRAGLEQRRRNADDPTVMWTFCVKGSVDEQVVGGRNLVHEMRWLFSQEMSARWPWTDNPVSHWYERLDIRKDVRHYPAADDPEFLMHVTRYRIRARLPNLAQEQRFGAWLGDFILSQGSYAESMYRLLGINVAKRVGTVFVVLRGASGPADGQATLALTREEYQRWHGWSYRLHEATGAPSLLYAPGAPPPPPPPQPPLVPDHPRVRAFLQHSRVYAPPRDPEFVDPVSRLDRPGGVRELMSEARRRARSMEPEELEARLERQRNVLVERTLAFLYLSTHSDYATLRAVDGELLAHEREALVLNVMEEVWWESHHPNGSTGVPIEERDWFQHVLLALRTRRAARARVVHHVRVVG